MEWHIQRVLEELREAAGPKPHPLGRFADLRNGGMLPGTRWGWARITVFACAMALALVLKG